MTELLNINKTNPVTPVLKPLIIRNSLNTNNVLQLTPDYFSASNIYKYQQPKLQKLEFIDKTINPTHFITNKSLENYINKKITELGLKDAGVVLIDLNNNEIASVNGQKSFYPASVIKVAVMAEAFHQASTGRINLDLIITVSSDNVAPTWLPDRDKRPLLKAGSKASIRHLIELMITRSDNTATNVLIGKLGRKNITKFMADIGLNGILVNRKLSVDYDKDATGRNSMTSLETAKLLAMIAKGELVDVKSSKEMMNILGGQMDNEKIPAGLPKNAKVYHKTGETSTTTHDAGIIEIGRGSYVLSIFTNLSPGFAVKKIASLTSQIINYKS